MSSRMSVGILTFAPHICAQSGTISPMVYVTLVILLVRVRKRVIVTNACSGQAVLNFVTFLWCNNGLGEANHTTTANPAFHFEDADTHSWHNYGRSVRWVHHRSGWSRRWCNLQALRSLRGRRRLGGIAAVQLLGSWGTSRLPSPDDASLITFGCAVQQ